MTAHLVFDFFEPQEHFVHEDAHVVLKRQDVLEPMDVDSSKLLLKPCVAKPSQCRPNYPCGLRVLVIAKHFRENVAAPGASDLYWGFLDLQARVLQETVEVKYTRHHTTMLIPQEGLSGRRTPCVHSNQYCKPMDLRLGTPELWQLSGPAGPAPGSP